ncbi:M15 family metallopeptidase [Gillisia limnaea]|uniref:D-alanyl-D-alanine dipeptidase n=1 Tax=Gillisia limnaea (strain DSM 15749 / LMG 21470 / R-8282) TaxID=865937 RepID=H2BVB0_GILLR|nr:M15 family metallopeptidase [Gillisia limnaea]EHQ01775.1 D-Ala-D-Ala dipeptidase vanX [Gillisia limnaea DSM 15749]
MKRFLFLIIISFSLNLSFGQEKNLPSGFVYVKEMIPDIVLEMRYAGNHNFIGKPINGYQQPKAILTTAAAEALKKVQIELENQGYCLKIFDAYRPQRAVNHFIEWARNPKDAIMKATFYPGIDKKDLFSLGYISTRSGHSRGSTVDLTLIDANTGEEINMGGSYDFFGEISHHDSTQITLEQKEKRELLKQTMSKHGFRSYLQEWWHYTLRIEPYPDTYFDFEVE